MKKLDFYDLHIQSNGKEWSLTGSFNLKDAVYNFSANNAELTIIPKYREASIKVLMEHLGIGGLL